MNPQELSLILKGVQLSKEGHQLIGISTSIHNKHKMDTIIDHIYHHMSDSSIYHSMSMRDNRKCDKNRSYFSKMIDRCDEGLDEYIEYLTQYSNRESPSCIILHAFDYLLKYLSFSRTVKLFNSIHKILSKNISISNII